MGGCGTKTDQHEVTVPQNQRQQMINQQFSQFLRLDHPLNVNHKYSSFFKIIPEQFTGTGIRKTNQYESRLSKGEWIAKKEEFWGQKYVSQQKLELKDAKKVGRLYGRPAKPMNNAIAILAAGELKLVNKTIQILYDAQGHKYDVPIFCINEPIQFPDKPSTEAGLKQDVSSQDISEIVVRATKFTNDIKFDVSTQTHISDIKTMILDKKEVQINKIRLFYNGREMQDHHLLGNYGIANGTVLQAYCS